MSFPRYPKYKQSGVEWLGEVPEHWECNKIRHIARITGGGTPSRDRTEYWNGDIPWVSPKDMKSERIDCAEELITKAGIENSSTSLQSPGKVLMVIRSGILQHTIPVSRNAVPVAINQDLKAFDFDSRACLPEFFFRWVQGLNDTLLLVWSNEGATVESLNLSLLQGTTIFLPSLPEQHAIASFLDREAAKIDALIAEQQRLIELLQEKRQAVISHAVTKGLNPDAPMKDSGIEWLGEVPAHWEVARVKNYFITCSGGTPNTAKQDLYYTEEGDGYPWVRTTDLNNDRVSSVPLYITEQAVSDSACSLLPPGTVMVAMYGGDGTVGKNGLLTFHATINQAVCGLLPSSFYSCDFIFRYMQFYRPYWMIGAESSRKDPNISQDRVRNAPVVRPPIEEQKLIAEFIEQQIDVFNGLQTAAESSISLLQERRSALISAAVTGQIDVRGLAPKEAA